MSKKPKFRLHDGVYALSACSVTAAFCLLFTIITDFAGGFELRTKNTILFIILLFGCSVAAGSLVYFARIKKARQDADEILKATEKILKGEFDIGLKELSGNYLTVGKAIEKLADHLRLVEEGKNDFINDFSHELKTPIVSIRGFAKLLAKPNLSESEKLEYISIIVSESDRLINLATKTLMVDKLENTDFKVEQTSFNLSELLRKCLLMLQAEWEDKNLEIDADFEDFFALGNEELLSQLFINILQNAIKFSKKDGVIKITVDETDREIAVHIIDYGVGMDETTQKKMFDKYFRADKSRTTPGNGLGLSTVKRIAEICHLSLKVKSSLGKGTDFCVTFKK